MSEPTKARLNFGKLNSSNLKLKLSGISGAFMLPIASMAITSLFLSVGGVVNQNGNIQSQIGRAIQSIAFPLLQAFPLLICISFALAFTKKHEGIAVWCALLGFLTFTYFNSAFISCANGEGKCVCSCGGTEKNGCCKEGKCCLLPCCTKTDKFQILFEGAGREGSTHLIHQFFGVTTLNCSIFAPMIIGGVIVPYLFRRWSEIKLPACLAYFSGKRLLPLLTTLAVIPLALLFLTLYPWIGIGLSYAGNYIAKGKGADAFFFGFLEKLLIPTGFHHLFASLFWYTPLGGDLLHNGSSSTTLCEAICKSKCSDEATCCCLGVGNHNSLQWQGDALLGASALALPTCTNGNHKLLGCGTNGNSNGIHIGRFTQGKFPIMQFALPAAALAIYFSAPKKNSEKRKELSKTLFPGMMNSIVLGITEPIEFSFMYSIPKLFYCFHTVMCGVSFLAMKLAEAHIPTAFSGGIIELLINGVIPYQKGTQFYYWAAVGGGLAVVYFAVFYFFFKKQHIKDAMKLNDQSNSSEEGQDDEGLPPHIASYKRGLGGWDNVSNYKNCASRLRYDIKDRSKVIESELKKAGVIAIKWVSDNHVQLIVGPKAEEINTTLLSYVSVSYSETTIEIKN
ncbi:phosphoenolpyruvate-dependent sugar phosphotransferase system, IIBC component [Mycoplasma wenyonii str. Massachusetts]|uniref:Phosphoenolpyruvate-dependent sugar phosphotransferase system, IIBC component n=1 Tax=Mycoplasma wenyonii (strain Massachusetts) TaxID=1197325 RepID=I6YBP1_MYCWM|nr:PTS transporter subunit EIIC [Mycoplasma wenyonii]AFN65431.1 phosphoenolpyruvate-dependent sugar phosphotransferase system, IIBC component [Mycoplasma wenyonii str. Massachusetts]